MSASREGGGRLSGLSRKNRSAAPSLLSAQSERRGMSSRLQQGRWGVDFHVLRISVKAFMQFKPIRRRNRVDELDTGERLPISAEKELLLAGGIRCNASAWLGNERVIFSARCCMCEISLFKTTLQTGVRRLAAVGV